MSTVLYKSVREELRVRKGKQHAGRTGCDKLQVKQSENKVANLSGKRPRRLKASSFESTVDLTHFPFLFI